MQRLSLATAPDWNVLKSMYPRIFLLLAGIMLATNIGSAKGPTQEWSSRWTSILEQPMDTITQTKHRNGSAKISFRKISARRLPLDLLEEFRKDYPAAVELEWEYRVVQDTQLIKSSSNQPNERLLRLDSKIYRVQGYNLGQYFMASYCNTKRYQFAVHEKGDELDVNSKAALQTAFPDWICLGFTRNFSDIHTPNHRILIARPNLRQTRILSMDSENNKLVSDPPKQWKRRHYNRFNRDSFRVRFLNSLL